MTKKLLSLREIKSLGAEIAPGTICEFEQPVTIQGCPEHKYYKKGAVKQFVKIQVKRATVVEHFGEKTVLSANRLRENGHEQKAPKFMSVVG